MQTGNKTLYAIRDDAERSLLILWNFTVIVSSLIGDSIILIATIKYRAIKLHKLVITVMQHMAVCDLIQTVLRVFPGTLAIISDRWVVGELLCHVEVNVTWASVPVTVLLTCAMTTLKLITVKCPLRSRAWSTRLGHKICFALWFLALCWYTPLLVVRLLYIGDTVHLSFIEYGCAYDRLSPSVPIWYTWYFPISVAVLSIFSFTTLIVTSVLLLIVASRAASQHGETLRWEGVTTVLLTVGVFFLSYLPFSLWLMAYLCGVEKSTTSIRAIIHITNLNIMANFFVYSLTVRSFRHFLKVKISELLSLMRLAMQGLRRGQLHQRPVDLQRQRLYLRQRPNPTARQDPPEVQDDDILNPAVELQGSQLQEDGVQHFSNILETPV